MKLKARLYVALGITIFIFACKSENNQTKFPTPIVSACDSNSFSKHVKPIIDLNCASSTSCHATGALNVEFTSYDLMVPFFSINKNKDESYYAPTNQLFIKHLSNMHKFNLEGAKI